MTHEYCMRLQRNESRTSNGTYSVQYLSLNLSELPGSGFLLLYITSVLRHQRYACDFDMGIDGDKGGAKWTGEWNIDRSKRGRRPYPARLRRTTAVAAHEIVRVAKRGWMLS